MKAYPEVYAELRREGRIPIILKDFLTPENFETSVSDVTGLIIFYEKNYPEFRYDEDVWLLSKMLEPGLQFEYLGHTFTLCEVIENSSTTGVTFYASPF